MDSIKRDFINKMPVSFTFIALKTMEHLIREIIQK